MTGAALRDHLMQTFGYRSLQEGREMLGMSVHQLAAELLCSADIIYKQEKREQAFDAYLIAVGNLLLRRERERQAA